MRLDNKQKEALYNAIKGIENEIYLFGSRVDDTKKGGDIDILIFSKENKPIINYDTIIWIPKTT